MQIKTCKTCGKKIKSGIPGKGYYCSTDCYNKKAREKYSLIKKDKICKYCGGVFKGTGKQLLCDNCVGTRIVIDQKIKKEYVCRRCGKVVCYVTTKTKGIKNKFISKRLCADCQKLSLLSKSERMKSDVNPSIIKFGRKSEREKKKQIIRAEQISNKIKKKRILKEINKTGKSKELLRLEMSDRMKKNNPMFNKETVDKVSSTLTKKYKTGDIKKTTGKNHWFWKGNRDRAQTIRSRLYPVWIRPILERDNFTCCRCGTHGKRLEVHHVNISFSDIIDLFTNNTALDDLSYDDFEIVSTNIINFHMNNVIGITYCVRCHKEVDPRRR